MGMYCAMIPPVYSSWCVDVFRCADYMYFLVVRSALDVFDCDKDSDGRVFLVMAPAVPCWEREHLGIVPFGVGSLLVCEFVLVFLCSLRDALRGRWIGCARLFSLHTYEAQRCNAEGRRALAAGPW